MQNRIAGACVALVAALVAGVAVAAEPPAKVLFGKVDGPAPLAARSIGFYSRGCLAGASQLPVDGPEWQVMRLSRNRYWGMPELVAYVEKLARDARAEDGWPGLLVGDLSQPRGGPMVSGHASHQIGLDVDIWFVQMPDRTLTPEEREAISAISLIKPGTNVQLDPALWTDGLGRLLKRAASYPEVERIFVNAGIKKKLCDTAGSDRAWLRKIRPWYKHDDHFHVRLSCPPGLAGCKGQEAVPAGDGCGENLAWWLGPAPYRPAPKPAKPAPDLTLASLPALCRDVLEAGKSGDSAERPVDTANVPLPTARPKAN